MRKVWYSLFYSLCAFTIAFSFYWMATVPPRSSAPAQPASPASSSPALRAGNALSGVPQEETEQEEGTDLHSALPQWSFVHSQVNQSGNDKHDARAKQRSVKPDHIFHLLHEHGHRASGEQNAHGSPSLESAPRPYASRSQIPWKCSELQNNVCRLFLTAK